MAFRKVVLLMEETIVYNSLARQLAPQIEAQLQTVVEPDLEIDVFNLGLIYAVDLTPEGHCRVCCVSIRIITLDTS